MTNLTQERKLEISLHLARVMGLKEPKAIDDSFNGDSWVIFHEETIPCLINTFLPFTVAADNHKVILWAAMNRRDLFISEFCVVIRDDYEEGHNNTPADIMRAVCEAVYLATGGE